MPRVIHLVHVLRGRTRLRLPWLRTDASLATPLADGLRQVPGIEEVEVRPYTGSVLCQHDPDVLDAEALLEEVKRLTGVTRVIRPGEELPEDEAVLRAMSVGNDVARAAVRFVKGLNVGMLRTTEGHVDLGTLLALGFVVAGAAEVAVTGRLPMPQWFNLAWWGLRTFTLAEDAVIDSTRPPRQRPESAAPVDGGGEESPEEPGPATH